MTNLPTVDDLLTGGAPVLKFAELGTTHRGVVVKAETTQQTDIQTGAPLFWPDGKPKAQLVVTLRTEERDPANPHDDGERRLYVKGSASTQSSGVGAIVAALKAVGAARLEPGDELAMRYVRDGEATTPGFTPPKEYVAQVRKGAAPPAVEDLMTAPIDPTAGGPFESPVEDLL